MATVTELVDLICADTGLDATAATAERTAALLRLNHANRQIVQQLGGLSDEATLVPAASATLLAVTDTASVAKFARFLALDYVQATDNTGEYADPIPQLPLERIKRSLDDLTAGPPEAYAYEYPNIYWDRAADGVATVKLGLRLSPLTLVESGPSAGTSESTPTSLPPVWHERVLASLACVLVLERYEGREADASYHRQLFNEAMSELRAHRSREGGRVLGTDPYSLGMFDL